MAAVTFCSDFGAQENKICLCFPFFSSICHEVMGPDAMILVFEHWVLSQHFFSPLLPLSRGSPVSLYLQSLDWYHMHIWSCLIFFLEILIPACGSSSLAFCMMYSAQKLNKQGDSIQPWHTPFPIWNQSVVPCPVLTVAPWPTYKFLRRQVRWSGISIS